MRALLFLVVPCCFWLCLAAVYASVYTGEKIELRHTRMKRQEIKRRPMADTTLAKLEPEASVYREHDGNGLYFRVKPNGQKAGNCATKKQMVNGHG